MRNFGFRYARFFYDAEGGAGGAVAAPGATGGAAAPAEGGAAAGTGAAGGEAALWYASHPDQSVRQVMQDKRFDTPDTLATAYVHAQKALGGAKDVIAVPGDSATDEQRAAFYTALGRPQDAAGYDFTPPQGQTNDAGMEKWARDAFFKAGLSGSQASQLYQAWNENAAAQAQGHTQAEQQKLDQLRATWGASADTKIAAGKEAAKALGLAAADMDAIERAAGSVPLVKLLVSIGERMGGESGKFVTGAGAGTPTDPASMSPEQARAAITQQQGDAEFQKVYTDKLHPGHKDAVAKMEKLFAAAYPRR